MPFEYELNNSSATIQMDSVDRTNRELELEKEILHLKGDLETSTRKKTEVEDKLFELRAQLVLKQQTEDELKQQIRVLSEFAINNGAHQKTVDLQRMYAQMVRKDEKIVELNNTILEKERQIIDLQEMCREQNQVATAKSLAVQIVNKRLRDLDSRKFQDASTQYLSSDGNQKPKKFVSNGREVSPGRALPQLKVNGANGSPPPADPIDDLSSYTTEPYPDEMDFDREWSASPSNSYQTKKHRKRVTFDLNAVRKANMTPEVNKIKQQESTSDDLQAQNLAQAVIDLSNENDQLRQTIAEMERALADREEGDKIAELEEEAEHARKEGKNQALRAKAASVARIKNLETKLMEVKVNSSKEIENLKAANEVLKSSREWALLENLELTEQLSMGKTKLEDLRGELDSSLNATTYYRQKLESEERRSEDLGTELRSARASVQQLSEERDFYQSEISRLKDAITAQDEFVSLLEGDLIVYEAHVGILRESLGASKKEDRQIIRSRAFNAKLQALELEKKEIVKRNNDERIRTKALNVKIRLLEEERDLLSLRLQQYEGEASGNVGDLTSTDDELMHDTKPTFDEQDALNVGFQESTVSEPIFTSGTFSFEPHESHIEAPPPAEESPVHHSRDFFQSPTSTVQTVNYIPDIESGSQNLIEADQPMQKTIQQAVRDLEQIHGQHFEAMTILNRFMGEIVDHLRAHNQKVLADQLERELRTYQISPDVDLVVVTSQVRRFIDEVINSLLCNISTLSIEKKAMQDQKELTELVLKETESVKSDIREAQQENVGDDREASDAYGNGSTPTEAVESELVYEIAKLQDSNSKLADEHSRVLFKLNNAKKKKEQLEQTVDYLQSELERFRVEAELSRNCLDDLRNSSTLIMEERDELEQKIACLQTENLRTSNEHARILASFNDSQQQKEQLEQMVDALQSELDRLRVEVELSRNCLEDLRADGDWRRQNSNIVHTQPPPLQPIQRHHALQQTPASAFIPVERTVENTAKEALQVGSIQQHVTQLDQQPGPSHYRTITQQDVQQNNQVDSNEVITLGDITRASQRVANYLQSQSEKIAGAKQAELISSDCQTEHISLRHFVTQTDNPDENSEKIGWLEEALNQKESALRVSMGECDHLSDLYSKIRTAYDNLQQELGSLQQLSSVKEQEQSLLAQQHYAESEHFRAAIAELHQNIDQLLNERNALQGELNAQRQWFDAEISRRESIFQELQNSQQASHQGSQFQQENNQLREEIDQLRHQVVQLRSESMYNAQLSNEHEYLRQQFSDLRMTHNNEIEALKKQMQCENDIRVQGEPPLASLNVDFSHQFDSVNCTEEESTQTELDGGESLNDPEAVEQPAAYVNNVELGSTGPLSQFSAAAMTRVVREQKEILKLCIQESIQLEDYMANGVEHLVALNAELEQCAESIKAQVHALSQQISFELADQTEQIAQNLSRLASSSQIEQLRSELTATRAENDQNLRRISDFQHTHQTLQKTYEELAERYTTLQKSFEELQNVSSIRAQMEEKSTDALLDGSTIDRICDLNSTIEEMAVASSEARNQLNEYQRRLQSLQLLMSTQLNSTQDKLKDLNGDEVIALKSSVIASISEFKMYLLHSFGQLQRALETTRNEESSFEPPDESSSISKELENTGRISRALVLCEKICRDIEEDSRIVNEHANSSRCLETMLNQIHIHWRAKQEELAEKAKALNEQRHLSEVLEDRLNEAETQLNLIASRAIDPSAIMSARLITKQADNDALFRCNSELVKTNVDLHTQVEHLKDCVQRVSDELDAVTNSISSNSRQSSLASLNIKQQDDQEGTSPQTFRRRIESEEIKEHLPVVSEDLNEQIETTLDKSFNNPVEEEQSAQVSIKLKRSESSRSTVVLKKKKKKKEKKEKTKEIEPDVQQVHKSAVQRAPNIEEDAWAWGEEEKELEREPATQRSPLKVVAAATSVTKSVSPAQMTDETQQDWGWNEDEPNQQNSSPVNKQNDSWGWEDNDGNDDNDDNKDVQGNWEDW